MNLFKKFMVRKQLMHVFKIGGLFVGTSEHPTYPKISEVKEKDTTIEIKFVLPNALNPKDVEKNEFIFLQVFGEKIKLEIDIKYCSLTIYQVLNISNVYDYENLRLELKKYRLGIIAGKDLNGKIKSYCMTKNPHLLISGETGSGKSTQIRQILTTLILTKTPKQLKLYLADCKRSEFHIFRNVEHVEGVYTKVREIKSMLQMISKELDLRSDLLESQEVANIEDLPPELAKPYIVVCIDEFVMLRHDKEIMDLLVEISALGRSLGIFVILSMQRPSANVIDTRIRACLTVSMSFKLRDRVEERIANTPGASKLEQAGELILNNEKNFHLKAPYLELEGAKKLLEPYKTKKEKKPLEVEIEPITILSESDVFLDVK